MPRQPKTEISDEIRLLAAKGAIERTSTPRLAHNLFSVPKPDGSRRPIADLRPLNSWIEPASFRMEALPQLRSMLRQGEFMSKTDIRDAFLHVPVAPLDRDFLAFIDGGRWWRWRTLPFGMSASPLIFTRLMRAALQPLRRAGIRLLAYLDDILLVAPDEKTAIEQTARLRQHLRRLGFHINVEKSTKPSRVTTWLGFQVDSRTMSVAVPAEKWRQLRREVAAAIRRKALTPRELARLVGRLNAVRAGVDDAPQRLAAAEALKKTWLRASGWSPTPRELTEEVLDDLRWWRDVAAVQRPSPLSLGPIQAVLTTDASPTGFGARLETAGQVKELWAPWTAEESRMHITARETIVPVLALPPLLSRLGIRPEGRVPLHILWRTDSLVAVGVALNRRSFAPGLRDVAKRLWSMQQAQHVRLTPRYLPSAEMIASGVDELSRRRPEMAAHLSAADMAKIRARWGQLTPATDQLLATWSLPSGKPLINPPWNMIGAVLQRLRELRAPPTVLLVPRWPGVAWWPELMARWRGRPLLLPAREGQYLRDGSTLLPALRVDTIAVLI